MKDYNKVKFALKNNLTYDNLKSSIMMLNVFYSDLHYTQIDEIATYSISDLVGLVGGNLGLFIG